MPIYFRNYPFFLPKKKPPSFENGFDSSTGVAKPVSTPVNNTSQPPSHKTKTSAKEERFKEKPREEAMDRQKPPEFLLWDLFRKTTTRNAKCPIFLGNFTPKTSNYCLENWALGFPGSIFWRLVTNFTCLSQVGVYIIQKESALWKWWLTSKAFRWKNVDCN